MSFEFDPSFTFNTDGLPPHLAQRTIDLRMQRRLVGLNVQFISERGQRDEWSFNTVESRDNFIRTLKAKNTPYAISH